MPTGKGKKKILIVGEAPGENEDNYVNRITGQRGKQFIGKSGQYLRDVLRSCNVDNPQQDCVWTNAIICRPPQNKLPANKNKIIEWCRPNLIRTIKKYKPRTIITCGDIATRSLVGYYWKENIGKIARWIDWRIPIPEINAFICPIYHPAFILRKHTDIHENYFVNCIEKAVAIKTRPKPTRNFQEEVEPIYDPSKAARKLKLLVRDTIRNNGALAIDYETTALKPEYEGAEIISISASNGHTTIAMPWKGDVIQAASDMWRSKVRKIASNMKFEDRWTRYVLNHPVCNWYWDTMLGAHILDNRKGITSVKFQTFVRFGLAAYDTDVDSYLKNKKGSQINRIRKLGIKTVLTYNGMDSIVEYVVAENQLQELKERSYVETN